MTQMGTHGQESREFKIKIMELHFQNGIPVKVLSEKFGIPEPTIYTWRNQHGAPSAGLKQGVERFFHDRRLGAT